MELTGEEARVLGVLLEKERTTPADYPLTANAVLRACNQSTSREPVVTYDEATVDRVLGGLRERGLTRIVYSPSNRAPKHRHVIDEVLGLDVAELALLAVLLLRGPQTPAELRARCERLHRFDEPGDVIAALEGLTGRDEPLTALLDRQAGRKEARWTQILWSPPPERDDAEAPETSPSMAGAGGGTIRDAGRAAPQPAPEPSLRGLQEQIDELRSRLDALVAELGGGGSAAPPGQ